MNITGNTSLLNAISGFKSMFGEKKQQTTPIGDLMANPETFMLEAYMENGEIIIKLKKRPVEAKNDEEIK